MQPFGGAVALSLLYNHFVSKDKKKNRYVHTRKRLNEDCRRGATAVIFGGFGCSNEVPVILMVI